MEKILFPSWRYHATEPGRIVQTPDEADTLGPEWGNTPGGPPAPCVVPEVLPEPAPAPEAPKKTKKYGKPLGVTAPDSPLDTQ